ncbi:hypothetical protein B566_EDAN002435 [Ephemera danica]|nr:hypothetical protein B566_EDAN002435 [Ephemera danica]
MAEKICKLCFYCSFYNTSGCREDQVSSHAMVDFTCPTPSATATAAKGFCDRTTVDDVLMVPPTSVYFFKGDQVALRLANGSISWGFPKTVSQMWPKLPPKIDASFTYSVTGKTYFLKGSQYWRYTNNVLDDGFPMSIAEGFAGVPDNIDAATEWGKYIYFFKDNLYYRYDACRNHSFAAPTTDFTGVPNLKYDAILVHPNGNAYFFIGDYYFHFNIAAGKTSPVEPYHIGWHWFICRY